MPFCLYIQTFTGSQKVLENFRGGPGKCLILFVSKRAGTLCVDVCVCLGVSRVGYEFELDPLTVGEVGITYEQMRTLIDSCLQ